MLLDYTGLTIKNRKKDLKTNRKKKDTELEKDDAVEFSKTSIRNPPINSSFRFGM